MEVQTCKKQIGFSNYKVDLVYLSAMIHSWKKRENRLEYVFSHISHTHIHISILKIKYVDFFLIQP
jgi:hypothetical protein